jgi:hypothetical protein
LESLFNEALAGAMDRRDPDAQGVSDLFVGRIFRRLEEHVGAPHFSC